MDISSLPEEVFIEIALYLNVEDLLACSLVSSYWRNAVNHNRIWFAHCAKRSSLNRETFELIEAPNFVEPVFNFPQLKCETLSDLCPWRKRFMQEAHISRNWRFARYTSKVITKYHYENCQVECEENVLVIGSIEREFTVFSIVENPIEIQTVSYSLWHVSSDFFKLCNNKLVVVQCTLLQIFDKTPDNKFELVHRSLFNKSNGESDSIPVTPDVSDWYRNNIGLYPSDLNTTCDHNGKYFVGLIQEGNLNKAVFHIWNLASGEKSAEEVMPKINERVLDIHFSLHKSTLHILLKILGSTYEYTTVCFYSLDTFQFTEVTISYDYVVPVMLFSDNFVLNTDTTGKSILLWRSDTGNFVHKITCDCYIHPMTVQIAYPCVAFAANRECSALVKIFDTETLQPTCEFMTDYKVINLLCVRTDFILAGGWLGFHMLGLWDIKAATKLYTLNYFNCIWSNSNNSKIVVESDDQLVLLHFW